MHRIVATGVVALALAGCASVPQQRGTNYDCSGGTKLNVNYTGNGAIVRVNGRQTLVLKATPANSGQIYENKSGARLARNGNDVTWNTALRSAAESCRVVYTPL